MSDYRETCPCIICAEWRATQEKAAPVAAPEVKEVPTSRTLTREMLLKGNPCYDYRTRFIQRFTDGKVEVTLEMALEQKDDWDWFWAGSVLLTRQARAEFSKRSREADKAFDESMAPYWDLDNAGYEKLYAARNVYHQQARDMGLTFSERANYADKMAKDVNAVQRAATRAASQEANRIKEEALIRAFVELFLTDSDAYEEEHRNDPPFIDNYDEDGFEISQFDENGGDYYEEEDREDW